MNTKLDKRQEVINKIKEMSNQDFKSVKIFISGMEVEKMILEKDPKKTA